MGKANDMKVESATDALKVRVKQEATVGYLKENNSSV